MMPISNNPEMYPTGSFFVASPQWVQAVLEQNGQGEIVEEVLKKQVLLMPEEIVAQIVNEATEVPDAPVSMDFMEEDSNEDN
jgi:hypothetical protein